MLNHSWIFKVDGERRKHSGAAAGYELLGRKKRIRRSSLRRKTSVTEKRCSYERMKEEEAYGLWLVFSEQDREGKKKAALLPEIMQFAEFESGKRDEKFHGQCQKKIA